MRWVTFYYSQSNFMSIGFVLTDSCFPILPKHVPRPKTNPRPVAAKWFTASVLIQFNQDAWYHTNKTPAETLPALDGYEQRALFALAIPPASSVSEELSVQIANGILSSYLFSHGSHTCHRMTPQRQRMQPSCEQNEQSAPCHRTNTGTLPTAAWS